MFTGLNFVSAVDIDTPGAFTILNVAWTFQTILEQSVKITVQCLLEMQEQFNVLFRIVFRMNINNPLRRGRNHTNHGLGRPLCLPVDSVRADCNSSMTLTLFHVHMCKCLLPSAAALLTSRIRGREVILTWGHTVPLLLSLVLSLLHGRRRMIWRREG